MDENLTSITNFADGHLLCVISVMYSYEDYYVTIGHESGVAVWSNGVQIDKMTGAAPNRLY